MEKLKPCPFCGGENVYRYKEMLQRDTKPQYQIVCDYNGGGCGASSGYYDDPQQAIASWNRRVEPDV